MQKNGHSNVNLYVTTMNMSPLKTAIRYNSIENEIEIIPIAVQNNTQFNNEMVTKYKVTLVPTIILLTKDKHVNKRIEGYVNASTFDNYLRELCND